MCTCVWRSMVDDHVFWFVLQGAPETPLSPPPQLCSYTWMSLSLPFTVVLGLELMSSGLHSKGFTNCAVSPVSEPHFCRIRLLFPKSKFLNSPPDESRVEKVSCSPHVVSHTELWTHVDSRPSCNNFQVSQNSVHTGLTDRPLGWS